ncbi:MAG: nucleotidyl transferase AbiEii/AbiGii toxin family protein [Bacteroidia bacterium]|nr:nucleotidyl transferase AbiEii/AbiGii toxin family protein [Bacteroidia bacterium]
MIPEAYITEWSNKVLWQTNEQVEHDLVISRAIVEIFKDDFLSKNLAFRGGTALYKLFLPSQPRYSEDIDLVQMRAEPIKETILHLQNALSFLGKSSVASKLNNNTLYFRFDSEIPPLQKLRLKVEINCREHFSVLGWVNESFTVSSSWFDEECKLMTYHLEELLGTKLRALYQRRKGRDLFDLWKALTIMDPDLTLILKCYHEYMSFSLNKAIPTKKEYFQNIQRKRVDGEFLSDITGLISKSEIYDQDEAFELVITKLIDKM